MVQTGENSILAMLQLQAGKGGREAGVKSQWGDGGVGEGKLLSLSLPLLPFGGGARPGGCGGFCDTI
jgi:hypothetical protein